MKAWEKLNSRIIHKNKWYKIRKDKVIRPDGKLGFYHVIDLGRSVSVIAINSANQIILVEQFRYPTQTNSLELPGGNTDGQNPLTAAKRELLEETGLIARKWKLLSKFQPANGVSNEACYLFLAKDLKRSKKQKKQGDEDTTPTKMSLKKIFSMIKKGKILDAHTITGLSLALLKKEINY